MQMSDEEVPDVELPSDVGSTLSDVELPADVGADPDDTVAATQVVVESPKLQVHRKPSHKALQEVKKKPCAKRKPVQKRNTGCTKCRWSFCGCGQCRRLAGVKRHGFYFGKDQKTVYNDGPK